MVGPVRRVIILSLLVGAGACHGSAPGSPGAGGAKAGAGGSAGGGGRGGAAGVAGAIGTAGAGGLAAGTGGAGDGAWLNDPAVWTAVPGGEPCGIAVADVTKPGAPAARTWSSCGDGCLVASALTLPSDNEGAGRNASAAATVGSEVFVRMETGNPTPYTLVVITRLSDGVPVAAVKQTASFSSCGIMASQHAALAFPFLLPSPSSVLVGLASHGDGAVTWSPVQSLPALNVQVMSNDLGWAIQLDDGSVRALMPPTGAMTRLLDQGFVPTAQGGAVLDRMVWSSAYLGVDPEVIVGYTPAAGVQQLVAQETDDHIVALSDTTVVWIGTTGLHRHDGLYETAQLFWALWPEPAGPLSINAGPLLPATNGLSSLKTWGDFAATIGCPSALDTCELLVVKLSTGKLWRIPRRPGAVFLDVMAVSPTELLLDEIDYPGGYVQIIKRLVRLDLTRLDALERSPESSD